MIDFLRCSASVVIYFFDDCCMSVCSVTSGDIGFLGYKLYGFVLF